MGTVVVNGAAATASARTILQSVSALGYEFLKAELGNKRRELADELSRRSDSSENRADRNISDGMDDVWSLQNAVRQLEFVTESSIIVNEDDESADKDVALIGRIITIRHRMSREQDDYLLLGTAEIPVQNLIRQHLLKRWPNFNADNIVSSATLFAQEMIGKRVGDSIAIPIGNKESPWEIISVSRMPQ